MNTNALLSPTIQEVISTRSKHHGDHTKADMYSLGVVFFEMNFSFRTQSERIVVLEKLRKPEIIFPETWSGRILQRQSQSIISLCLSSTNHKINPLVITSLLQHDVSLRPTAQQLASSGLLPSRIEDEYFRDALSVMSKISCSMLILFTKRRL